MRINLTIVTVICCLLIITSQGKADTIKLPAIFGDNMVLQRELKVPIWGWANAGDKVQITFKGKTFVATAGSDGKWQTKLDSYHAGGPFVMSVKCDKDNITYKNIWIGDVYVASGQSNMEFGIQTEKHAAEAIKSATDSLIHFFYVPMGYSLEPQNDVSPTAADSPNGKWLVCSPQVMANPKWAWHGFSAAGFYFAQQIRKTQNCPVGVIGAYKGSTTGQAWVSIKGLQQKPAFNNYVSRHQQLVDHYQEAKAAYPQQMATYREEIKKWNEEVGAAYDVVVKQWNDAVLQAKAAGLPLPVKPKPSRPAPPMPPSPEGGPSAPSNSFNAVVAPLIPYGIKGVIWYQGESNGDRLADAVEYRELFPRLINDWRSQWNQGNFPFIFVQLTNFHAPAVTPSEGFWPWVREAQLAALSLPETGMAVITDVGETDNIHPLNKKDVGLRLALAARHVIYHEPIVFSGPLFKSMKVEGNKIRISFNYIGAGLVTGRQPSSGSAELLGCGIAGSDQKFVWAKAVIDGNTIVVSADGVTDPVAVRYNWGDNPPGNLYNKDGLPASPFRTDNWPPPATLTK